MGRSRTSFGTGNPGRPRGAQNKATRALKEFWQEFFDSPGYRENLIHRFLKGDAPHMEKELHHYCYGKPRDTIKVEGGIPAFRIVNQDDDSGT